ncbi:MAG TPA: hypothetical protein VLX92_29080 [Kofleriaceae bacterium]|nr:hypothetical protein [Kofleriaceae bacterium]
MHRTLLAIFAIAACHSPPPAVAPVAAPPSPNAPSPVPQITGEVTLDQLAQGEHVHGFTAVAVYLDDAGKRMGARLVHDATGFTFDYLRIESAPQGFVWVNSFPTSDKGEPHTQEHLLLGKGNRGRRLGSIEAMALGQSSAFTDQWRTAYDFYTVAGPAEFWLVFENQLDALLNPDYTDEEIRREVRNFGVDKAPDGTLRLEEKGTVYNEMVRTYESPEAALYRTAGQLVYGASHPLALESGGYPDAIRTMTPADIRAFHDAAYHLANMGMIGAFPSAMSLASVLDHTGAILGKEAGRTGKVMTEADLPRPAPAAPGTVKVVDYPYNTASNPGPMLLAWPATRQLDDAERTLLGLFMDALAGDESTPLYKQLIDSKTRTIDLGASSLGTAVSTDQGQPVFLEIDGVKPELLDDKTIEQVRAIVLAELDHLAKLPDGDPELVAFDAKMASRMIDLRRRYAKLLDSPPRFGFRDTGPDWLKHLHQLSKTPGFEKSLTLRPALAEVERVLAGSHNPWRDRIARWGLLVAPFGVAARPSPARRAQLDRERKARIDAELARLGAQYGTRDAAATLARFQADYDAQTKQLEASAQAVELPPLVASPPMTLDDGLKYDTGEIGEVRSLVATFDAMTSARLTLAFDVLHGLPPEDEMFLAALPALLSGAGVIEDGKPIPADEMRERMREEILDLSVDYDTNPATGRVELEVVGAGNGVTETRAALAWMKRIMLAPDWRIENLPRLRDVVDQQLTATRRRMLGPEERWVSDPTDAWWQQSALEYLHAASFLTQAHDLHRLRWMLLDPEDAKVTAEASAFLGALAGASTLRRGELQALATALARGDFAGKGRYLELARRLSDKAKPLARAAGKDLAELLADLPDSSLAGDWRYLCGEMAGDLRRGAPAALAKLETVRAQIIDRGRARLVEVASTANRDALAGDVAALATALPVPTKHHTYTFTSSESPIDHQLKTRGVFLGGWPHFVGLVDPATSSGVFYNLAEAPSYKDTKDDAVLDYLASNLYTGHGAHSMFMKTWAAGLAYSNGLHPRPADGMIEYYAERCPLLPQTLRFVIDQLRAARPDPSIARYAVATAFGSRVADAYESRAAAMAADLVDGLTPDLVRAFRARILELAKRPDLADVLFARLQKVYGKVLPGFGPLERFSWYFVIGPEKQLAAYEEYLHAAVGKDAKLVRLYPRDFWITQ